GFLSGIDGVTYNLTNYKLSSSNVVSTFALLIAQIKFFLAVLLQGGKADEIIYINTILPFGAAVDPYLAKKKVIYHLHEYPVKSNILHVICIWVMKKCASQTIFVSKYLQDKYGMTKQKGYLVYNALHSGFAERAADNSPNLNAPFTILMV